MGNYLGKETTPGPDLQIFLLTGVADEHPFDNNHSKCANFVKNYAKYKEYEHM